jgi:hypothetical protein
MMVLVGYLYELTSPSTCSRCGRREKNRSQSVAHDCKQMSKKQWVDPSVLVWVKIWRPREAKEHSAPGTGIEAEFSPKLRLLEGTISCRLLFAGNFSRR